MKTPTFITKYSLPIYSIFRLVSILLLCIVCTSHSYAEVTYLITDDTKVTGLAGASANTFDPDAIDDQTEATLPKEESFIVELENPIAITADEGLVVMFRRWNNEGSPKATRVEGLNEDENWDILGYSYMQFRGGNGTVEYSKPIYANDDTKGKEYSKLQANNLC